MYISDPDFDWFKNQVCEIFGFTDKLTPLQESDLYTQYRDAYRHGYNDGYSDGNEDGYDEGYASGEAEGYGEYEEDVEDGAM